MAPEGAVAERPELLLGAAFLGGLLLAGLVSRFGR
jgi:outer membrane murein-binding lipoprotein Lpp